MSATNTSMAEGSETDQYSIRDKAILRRTISKHHNDNMSAGYVPVHMEFLQKTGLRGRKTYAFWTLVGLLCLLACGNTVLTVIIFRVLDVGQRMEALELIPEENIVKWYGSADLGDIYQPEGRIDGFRDEGMRLTGNSLSLEVEGPKGRVRNVLGLGYNGTQARGVSNFQVLSGASVDPPVFSTNNPHFKLNQGVRNIDVKKAKLGRVSSGVGEKLILRSDVYTRMRGSEGTNINGKHITLSADQQLTLKAMNGSIIIGAKDGIQLDIKRIPLVGNLAGFPVATQYKVCVCMPQGKLFRVPVSGRHPSHSACRLVEVSPTHNPCA